MARVSDAWKDMTVPAINVRGLTYDVSRQIFKALKKMEAASCIFEIAKSEINYTGQRPAEYTTCVLGAAIREGHRGPVFIQGDHFQVNAKKFKENPQGELDTIKSLIEEAVTGGFYNIDIDTSTLVDLDKGSISEQQRANFESSAELTKHIRSVEPEGITVSVGGEIGEVGGQNSTPEELTAYIEGFNGVLSLAGHKLTGLSKISVQTGTSHGGVPLPDGSVAKVKLDFDVLSSLGNLCRKQFNIGGVVQHGASTLPENAFDNFPKRQTLEVHLATGFQNTILDSTAFPKNVREQMYTWLDQNCASERKPDQTPEQFYYKTRKKAFGPFKKQLWSLTDNTKSALMSELYRQFDMLFKRLGIENSAAPVGNHIKLNPIHHKRPTEESIKGKGKAVDTHDDNPNAD
jgi:fructose/tagatose bisphosphate aldolase